MKRKKKGKKIYEKKLQLKNFPNLGKDTDIKIQEAQRPPTKFNKSPPSERYIIVKFTKYTDKERILKASGGKKSP